MKWYAQTFVSGQQCIMLTETMENVCLSRMFAIHHRNANGKGRCGFIRHCKLTRARVRCFTTACFHDDLKSSLSSLFTLKTPRVKYEKTKTRC